MTAIDAYGSSKWFSYVPTVNASSTGTGAVSTSQSSNASSVDTVTISDAARAKNASAASNKTQNSGPVLPHQRGDRTASPEWYRDSLMNYDNSTAQAERLSQLQSEYETGTGLFVLAHWTPEKLAACKTPENYIGELKPEDIIQVDPRNSPLRAEKMKAWYEGTGTSQWSLEGVRNEDGFMVFANSDKALQAKSIWENADFSNAEEKLHAYMSAATLTPQDFTFYDATRLFALKEDERSDFLTTVDGLLRDAGITDVKASQLEYGFDKDGRYNVEVLGLEVSNRQEEIQNVINAAIDRAKKTGDSQLYNYAWKVHCRGIC